MHASLRAARKNVKAELIQAIRRQCDIHAEAMGAVGSVSLFGSFARGDFSGSSDVDLLILLREEDPDRAILLKDAFSGVADDVVVIGEQGYRQNKERLLFWRQLERDREIVWESGRG